MTSEDKIAVSQAIENGSVRLLLSAKKELAPVLLETIQGKAPTENNLVAWNELCNIGEWYLNGYHLLTYNSQREYKMIYLLNRKSNLEALNMMDDPSSGKVDVPRHAPEGNIISDVKSIIYANRIDVFGRVCDTVARGQMILGALNITPSTIVRAGATDFFQLIGSSFNVALECINHDMGSIYPVKMNAILCQAFDVRLTYLENRMKEYLKIVRPLLLKFFTESIRNVEWMSSETTRQALRSIFSVLGSDIKVDSPLFMFQWLPFPLKAYHLGFSLHDGAPLEKEVKDRLSSCADIPALQELIRKKSEEYVMNWIKTHVGDVGKEVLYTEEDTLMESIYNYFPFDIFPYYDGKKVYVFNRNLFQSLLERSQNFYNNEPLDLVTTKLMELRGYLAFELKLPKAACLTDAFSHYLPGAEHTPAPRGMAELLEGYSSDLAALSSNPLGSLLLAHTIHSLLGAPDDSDDEEDLPDIPGELQ